MSETKHIARGTDLTLIVSGILIVAAAGAWYRYGTGRYTPAAVGIAVLGVVCVAAGVAIIGYATLSTAVASLRSNPGASGGLLDPDASRRSSR